MALRQTEHVLDAANGNGTYSNPLFYEEFEDPDVIRVGDDYYLAGTTMHMNPAVQLMHSKDLVNWELAGYCTDRLDLGPAFRLEGGNIYGRGIWAPVSAITRECFTSFPTSMASAFKSSARSRSVLERNWLPGRHDMSAPFDDDGKVVSVASPESVVLKDLGDASRRGGDLSVDQSDARRHDAHVADESPLSRDKAQLPRPSDGKCHRAKPGS